MKKLLLSFAALSIACTSMAQLAKKYVLIEQFTQASCGPCAAENPSFRAEILNGRSGDIHHIGYHTSWPGVDPMYNDNKTQSASMVSYYGVSGVPSFFVLGEGVGSVSQSTVDTRAAEGSPIKVKVIQNVNKTTRVVDVEVRVITIGTVPSANYMVKAAIVETNRTYGTAPGSNGEKYFPNVFRQMLPTTTGSSYTAAAKGDSVVYNYTYTVPTALTWDMDSLKTVAFVQNTTTKEVLNAGSNLDVSTPITNGALTISSVPFTTGTNGISQSFNATVSNKGSATENFKVKLISDQPGDWSSSFTIDGNTFTDSTTLAIAAGADLATIIDVLPGASSGIGTYTLTLQSVDYPTTILMNKKVRVISNVTDLIVSSESGRGDGVSGNATTWESKYERGLVSAGNTTFAATVTSAFIEGMTYNVLAGVKNVYYNAGFTFPSLTDELVASLQTFIDSGGNLFLSGQDIGWETMDANGNGTTATKAFYTNYLKAKYIADGTSTNKPLNAFTGDYVFNTVPSSNIFGYYGAANIYPDQIAPLANSEPIFYYTTNNTKIAGIRNYNPTTGAKVVYLGVGIEMLSDTNVQKQIIKLSHDWFNGLGCTALNVEYVKQNIKCKDELTGMVDVTMYGGSGNYSYAWSNSATTDSIADLAAGNYTLTVTDQTSACTVQKTFTVTQPATALVVTVNYSTINGTATASPTGGSSPYTYLWNTGQTTKTITGVTTGTYTVNVTDANGCVRVGTTTITGINDISEERAVSVQPNPCSEYLNLILNLPSEENVVIEISNILGERVYSTSVKRALNYNAKIDMSIQPSGVYLVNIKTGNNAIVKKIIKQ